jgi:hypothetical protein
MTFAQAFTDELEKIAARKKKGRLSALLSTVLRGAAVGAGLGFAASGLAAPMTYAGYRMKPVGRKDALLATLLRMGERAAYGIPIGIAGSLGGN